MSVKLKNAAVILAACETKSGGATEGERALASLCASLEARMAEVEGELDLQKRATNVAMRTANSLGARAEAAEKRLAEVVKALDHSRKCDDCHNCNPHFKELWDAIALAHAHEEVRHEP